MSKIRSCVTAFIVVVILQVITQICVGALQYRLDTNVIPESYDIKIKPYLMVEDVKKQFTFDGEVSIVLHAVEPDVKVITLHKDYIEILQSSIYETDIGRLVQNINASDLNFEKETDKLSVNLQKALDIDKNYTLRFVYTGQIRNGMAGVFRASYIDANGVFKWIALTQAQRIDARTIVPCWDEPAFKAKFRMKISRPKEYISIFNTRLMETQHDEADTGRYLDIFEWTPKMSSYLLAFMVSQYVERGNGDLVILSRPEYYNYTEFSYEVASRTLEAYNNYTRLPYWQLGNGIMQKASSPKFPHNGMENWGLVLYKDSVLVQEPFYSDGWKDKQYMITILVHETAHMWFGNSVTFAWWSYFWLNEAFARYYQFYLAHEIYPEFQLNQQFVVNQVHSIFNTDALNTTQPLSTPEPLIQTPSQIASKFSSIAYAKGAAIVRMFRNSMGHENFDLAIHEYLKEFHLKSTVPSDLFKHLKKNWPAKPEVDLDQFFYDWTEQVGFPFLLANVSSDRTKITLQQQRFLLSPDDGSDRLLKYTIPLSYTTDLENNFEDVTPKGFMSKSDENWVVTTKEPLKWIVFNIQQSNFHRVLYDADTLTNIRKALESPQHDGIHVINRAQFIDDIFSFARIGMRDYADVFQFLEYLAHETEYLPWQAAFTSLPRVSQRLTVQQQKNFGKFIRDITSKVYEKMGVQGSNDTILDVYNRNNVVYWACKYNNIDCNKAAREMLYKVNNTKTWPTTDFRETLYCSAIRFGEFTNYMIVNQFYEKETRASEKELLLRGLGCTVHHTEYHYARILSSQIPSEYKRIALKPLYSENPENLSPVLHMIVQTYETLAEQLGGFSELADVISDLANYITSQEQKQSLEEFIVEHGMKFGYSITTLHTAAKTVQNNLDWAEERLGGLVSYLENRNTASCSGISLLLLVLSSSIIKLCL